MKIEGEFGWRKVLLYILDLVCRVVLAYSLIITIYLIAATYVRTHPVNVPDWIMGEETVSRLRTLRGLELIEYLVRLNTKYFIPAWCAVFLYGAVSYWRDKAKNVGSNS